MPSYRKSPSSVTALHPEHLLDKLGAGRLSLIEQRQLRSHAKACDACRFELLVRRDLVLESSTYAAGDASAPFAVGLSGGG